MSAPAATSDLVLIKHGPPAIDRSAPAAEWRLSEDGAEIVRRFAGRLRRAGLDQLVTSREPKAFATAEILASELELALEPVDDLHEHARRTVPFFDRREDFERAVVDSLRHPDELRLGEETAQRARARFRSAIEKQRFMHRGRRVGVVAHGTVIALYAADLTGADVVELWSTLTLPSAVILDTHARRITRILRT